MLSHWQMSEYQVRHQWQGANLLFRRSKRRHKGAKIMENEISYKVIGAAIEVQGICRVINGLYV